MSEQMAVTEDGTLKPVSEFTAAEKWWCDGEECDGWPLTVPHVHTYGDRPTRAVDLLTGKELELCPGGCGCQLGTDDADRRECGCDGGCCDG